MKLTPVMIEEVLHRVETGATTIADANMLRAYHLSLKARIDDDNLFGDGDTVYIEPDNSITVVKNE